MPMAPALHAQVAGKWDVELYVVLSAWALDLMGKFPVESWSPSTPAVGKRSWTPVSCSFLSNISPKCSPEGFLKWSSAGSLQVVSLGLFTKRLACHSVPQCVPWHDGMMVAILWSCSTLLVLQDKGHIRWYFDPHPGFQQSFCLHPPLDSYLPLVL